VRSPDLLASGRSEVDRGGVQSSRHGRTGTQDFAATSGRVLRYLRTTIGLDTWLVGRRQGEDWLVLTADTPELEGARFLWKDTLCARVHQGLAEWATEDVDAVPALVEARDQLGIPIRSFVTVPLRSDDGELLGTLCGVGYAPAPGAFDDSQAQLETFGDLLGSLLSAELRLEREARHREVAELDAQTDPLTGLGNRRRWDEQLRIEEQRCQRYGSSAAILTLDVNGLKAVNDRWGHDAGDALLRQMSDVLRQECRPGDVVARLGGDEFAVLLAEASAEQAEVVAERLQRAFEQANTSAALGLAVRGRGGLSAAWRDADARMYEQKRGATHREQPTRPPPASFGRLEDGNERVIQELLSLARHHVGADLVFLGRFEGRHRVMRAIESARALPVGPGHTTELANTICHQITTGELPCAIPDTTREPLAALAAAEAALPVGAHLGVPVRLPGGRLYGTVCCVSHDPNPRFDEEAVAFMRSIAESLGRVLISEEVAAAGRRQLLGDIDDMLGRDAVTMAYQPVIDLRSGAVQGVEALARFDNHSRSTAQWFEDAAAVERTSELEVATATAALQESRLWPGGLWLNLSASVIVSPAVVSLFAGQDLSRIVVEVSEREQVSDYAGVVHALAPWRDQGLRLAVDDAGAGFSSLRHVLELTPEVIKLDISLVQGLATDPARRALVTALVAFADEAGAVVVAEGIETEAELHALKTTGVVFGQGFLLGRALAAGAHEQLLRSAPDPRREPAPSS
jgi:diguanylate cyclase (GGDEF)-like protein